MIQTNLLNKQVRLLNKCEVYTVVGVTDNMAKPDGTICCGVILQSKYGELTEHCIENISMYHEPRF